MRAATQLPALVEIEVWREPAHGQAAISLVAPLISMATPYNCSCHSGEASGLNLFGMADLVGYRLQRRRFIAQLRMVDSTAGVGDPASRQN